MALITQTLYSTKGSGDYGMINDLMGQIVALIEPLPIITIISDNNPSSDSSRRFIKFKVGTSEHYYILYAYSTSQMSWELDKLDHSINTNMYGLFYSINSNRANPCSVLQNYNFFILHSNNIFFMWGERYKDYLGSYDDLPMFTGNDDGSWFAWATCYDFSLYTNTTDAQAGGVGLGLLKATVSGYDTLGNYYPIQCWYSMGQQIQPYRPVGLYSAYSTGLIDWSVYTDGTYHWFLHPQTFFITDRP